VVVSSRAKLVSIMATTRFFALRDWGSPARNPGMNSLKVSGEKGKGTPASSPMVSGHYLIKAVPISRIRRGVTDGSAVWPGNETDA
jgi:hypothetical protein